MEHQRIPETQNFIRVVVVECDTLVLYVLLPYPIKFILYVGDQVYFLLREVLSLDLPLCPFTLVNLQLPMYIVNKHNEF